MNAIDTNVFAYAYDPATADKQKRARQLLSELVQNPDETVLLWQVAVEFLACLRKAERNRLIDGLAVEAGFQEVLQLFAVKLPSAALFSRSFALLRRHSLSH